jgi:RNA polymerase sigma-70 factor (ECF subfamily)
MAEPLLETVRRAQHGDRDALAEIVAGQQRYVYSIAMSLMRDPEEAADLTQDAFVRLMRSIGTYRGQTKFTTWLYRLVVNLGVDRLRRRGRPTMSLDEHSGIADAVEDAAADTIRAAERREEATVVRAAIAALPDSQRLALTLHYFDDMRYEEIAEVMGLPLNTVKSHIRRGKERLERALKPLVGTRPAEAGS